MQGVRTLPPVEMELLLSLAAWGVAALALTVLSACVLAMSRRYRLGLGVLGGLSLAIRMLCVAVPILAVQVVTAAGLVLTPWWYLCQLLVIQAKLPVATHEVFFLSLAAYYLHWILAGFLGMHRRDKLYRASDDVPASGTEVKHVAVIGAGPAGLMAAKELQQEGHRVTVFEKSSGTGGVWGSTKNGGRIWRSTATSSSALNTAFSDHPVPVFYEENPDPLHFSGEQFAAVLDGYANRYQVWENADLRLNSSVVRCEPIPQGRWRLHLQPSDGDAYSATFDAVTVCTGLAHTPVQPPVPGLDQFKGQVMHQKAWPDVDPSQFSGKRVLVVGTGEGASDVVKDLADHGVERIFVSQRRSTLMLLRNTANTPPDYQESRCIYSGPMFNRYTNLFLTVQMMITHFTGPLRSAIPKNSLQFFKFLVHHGHTPLDGFPSVVAGLNVTKSDALWYVVDAGTAVMKPGLYAFTEHDVIFENKDRVADIDAVVFCTGYSPDWSYLPDDGETSGMKSAADATGHPVKLSARHLYKQTLHPDLENLAFICLSRGQVGSLIMSGEMQARYWALLVSGKRKLPSRKRMEQWIRFYGNKGRRFAQPARGAYTMAASLARNDIGCDPDMFKLAITDPAVWLRVWTGGMCGAHFRLTGPHANYPLARQQIMMPGAYEYPGPMGDITDIAKILTASSGLLVPIWDVMHCTRIWFFRRAIDSYI